MSSGSTEYSDNQIYARPLRTIPVTVNLEEQVHARSSGDQALEAVFGFTHTERKTYEVVVERDDPATASDIAAELECAQTSAYRYIDTLEATGLIRRVTADYEGTGRSAYVANPPAFVASRMEREVEEVFTRCQAAIENCRRTFERNHGT